VHDDDPRVQTAARGNIEIELEITRIRDVLVCDDARRELIAGKRRIWIAFTKLFERTLARER
jgi:hypothetical protein